MADNDYTAAPPVDDSLVGSPEYQDPGSTAVAPSMQDSLSGVGGTPPFVAPQAPPPDLSTPGQRPGYAGNIDGRTGQAIPNAPPQNKWERLFQTIAVGLSGSGDAKNFAQGLAGGAKAQLQNQQLQKENDIQQREQAIREQQSMDAHKLSDAQLATSHINQQILAAQYNTMPKSTQDILDQVMFKQGAELQGDPNAKSIFTGSYNDAVARSQAEMTQKGGNSPLTVRVLKNSDGSFSVWDVNNPDKLNDKPQDVVVSYDFSTGKPVTKTYPAGTITYAQKSQMETNAAVNIASANNQLEQHKAQSKFDQSTPQAQANLAKTQAETVKAQADAKKALLDAGAGGAGPEWKPKVTADEKKKAELAENIAFNANEVNGILARRPDLVGAISGRITNVEQMIGNNDPDISAIGTHIHNIAMANSGVHGFRSQEGVKDTEANLINHFKNGATAVKGAMDANVSSVQTFIDNARPSGYRTSSNQGGAGAFYAGLTGHKVGDTITQGGRQFKATKVDNNGKVLAADPI